eukprot:TRINITY_DN5049_c0_g1_i1.p2 TRINITY_DN5049_c0_g1~~TRINITY_DN5049_c0_g1_i1.p2  ORF type:complete len:211 (-),score=25.24 TRINITY_DN5049_c0_g1_i1:281-868(-)
MDDSEVCLPKTTLVKYVKSCLPSGMKMTLECQDTLVDVSTEFVKILSRLANTFSTKENKNTVYPEHVLKALEQLGLARYEDEINSTLDQFKADQKSSARQSLKATRAQRSGMSVEEQLELQQKMFADARAKSQNLQLDQLPFLCNPSSSEEQFRQHFQSESDQLLQQSHQNQSEQFDLTKDSEDEEEKDTEQPQQ